MNEILALIPARGGSKGIKNKNIIDLNGKPLIYYTIKEALNSNYIEEENIWCSTDSKEIAEVASNYGAKVPFIRPKEFATDKATSVSVAKHSLKWADNNTYNFKYILLLQPTSPLREATDIDRAIELMKNSIETDSVISVTEPDIKPFNMKYMNEDNILTDYTEETYNRRQDMPEIYCTNGAIYLTKSRVIFEHGNFYGDRSLGYVMNKRRSVDIDEKLDLKIAEFLIRERMEKNE